MKIVCVDPAHLDISYLLLPLEVCCFAGCVPVALDHHGEARVSRNGLSVEASLGQHDVTANKRDALLQWCVKEICKISLPTHLYMDPLK